MTGRALREARVRAKLTQRGAAARLGVSQPYYSQLENGSRRMTWELARVAVKRLRISPVLLPLPSLSLQVKPLVPADIAAALGALEYPGFLHAAQQRALLNPAELLVRVLVHENLDPRLVEALPWLLAKFSNLDRQWLLGQCRLLNLQNRLGYLVELADGLTRQRNHDLALTQWLTELDASRLAVEGTLCRESMTEPERRWVRKHRPPAAAHWSLLTTLDVDQLTYAA
jgi:transcriptional regulator with XRE-family HTH domain